MTSPKRRSIHFFTAARSDYDLMAPVIAELRARDQVDVGVIAGSAQLSPFHGSAIRQIEEDGTDRRATRNPRRLGVVGWAVPFPLPILPRL